MIRRVVVAALLLGTAFLQSGCEGICSAVGKEWGVDGCGEKAALNDAPEIRHYGQTEDFPLVGQNVSFSLSAYDPDGDALTIEWDFEGDGHVDEIESFEAYREGVTGYSSDNADHVFRAPTIAHLTARVSDFPDLLGAPGEATVTRRFRVHTVEQYERDRPPVASFTIGAQEALQFSTGHFDASGSTDPDGDRLVYSWRLAPDGVFASRLTSSAFAPILEVPGRNEWRLTVTDEYGKADSTSRWVNILPVAQAPSSVGIQYEPRPVLAGDRVYLTALASDPNDDITRYEWDLDGIEGYEVVDSDPYTTVTYATAGPQTIRLRVLDATGLSLSAGVGFEVREHGGPNSPTAALAVEPNPAFTGQTVSFSAAASTGPAPETARYHWDLNGDGLFEEETEEAVNEGSFSEPGDYTVRVRVIHIVDGRAEGDDATAVVRVNRAPPGGEGPTARLAIEPNPAVVGQTVRFDASASTDPTGDIVSYEWDLDGFPGYEVEPDGASHVERSYDEPGTFSVAVRVTDSAGHSREDRRTMQVEGGGSGGLLAAARAKPKSRPFSATLTGRTGRIGKRESGLGFDGLGRLKARLANTPRLTTAERSFKRFLGARWSARPRITLSRRGRTAHVSAVALAGRGRDRACVRVDFDMRAGELPRGTFEVLGGVGAGATLRGSGRFRFQILPGKPAAIVGHLRADSGRKRGLPAACRSLR